MNRRQLLASLAAAAVSPVAAGQREPDEPKGKKGWCGFNEKLHKTFRAHWYYTWTPGWQADGEIEFVPMIKTAADVDRLDNIERNRDAEFLLGFNEPERKDQGNLSVELAVDLWPRLERAAKRRKLPLGSPAPSSDKLGLDWLAAFMKQVKAKDLQVDFIAVHYYRSRRADDLERFIEDLAREYRRPIWLTEFNGWSGPEKEHQEFLRKSLRFLERSDDVQRYAYFDPKPGKPHSLHRPDGTPTPLGEIYQEAGS